MIVKISGEVGWRFFDSIEDVEIYETCYKEARKVDCPTEYMLNSCVGKSDTEYRVKVLKIFKNGMMYKRIVIDNNSAYLLNNEGKTIERLN